jgi:ribosomal-protein-alanine N-acetyltransferase
MNAARWRRSGDLSAVDSIVIEPMKRRHLRQVLEIETQVYPRPWTSGVFQSELLAIRAGRRHYAVARIGGSVVAYGGLMLDTDEAHVTNIAVDPRRRRRGLGCIMLTHLVHTARESGFTAMTLEVRVTNLAAQELYRQFGFVPAGIRKRYYENTDDAIVMWCHDLDGEDMQRRLERLAATIAEPVVTRRGGRDDTR